MTLSDKALCGIEADSLRTSSNGDVQAVCSNNGKGKEEQTSRP
jgi:hypothetical protein